MNKFFRITLVLMSLFFVGFVFSSVKLSDIPILKQQEQHAKVLKRVSDLYSRSHYKSVILNDTLSAKIFDRYIKMLDYNRQIFTKKDITKLQKYKYKLSDAIKSGNVGIAYKIFQLSLTRRYERYSYALTLLKHQIKFNVAGEKYQFDRTKAPWAADTKALNIIWQHRIKSDALTLKLSGKKWPEIKSLLTKRYTFALKHLTQTESEDIFEVFMNAFSNAIEPHTSYLSPRSAERFKMQMNLSLEGIGAVLQLKDGYTTIRSLVKNGPADKSKQIVIGDKIVGVAQDGEKMKDIIGWRLDDVVELIKGPKNSKVILQIESGKVGGKIKTVKLVRKKIHLKDREVKSSVNVIDKQKIGVITIPNFYVHLSKDIQKALIKLKKDKVKGIVIDLRNDGGGSLLEATLSTGLFIKKGPVVQVRDSRNNIEVQTANDMYVGYDGPLTVLINRNSASASEIFAAALQDYGRAIIIGEQSYGKGTVQQHRQIARFYDQDAARIGSVQYTIAKFYRINGGSTQQRGVTPDISFPTPIPHHDTGESLEKNALPWDNIKSAQYTKIANLSPIIKVLIKKHLQRIKKEIEFKYLAQDIAQYKKEKDDTSISLVERLRVAKLDKQESMLLKRTNERLKRAKKPTVKSFDDIPKDFVPIDSFLIEAEAITLDYANI
ncbi:MAG: carboxy terminal-processing peptidase [Psychromonas sp.]|nr:carboxy terminal-processing peptidase [Psychromonas sp.]